MSAPGKEPHEVPPIEEVMRQLRAVADRSRLEGMSRVGINTERALGVPMPQIRKLGKQLGQDHRLAQQLWATSYNDARILASIVDEPHEVTSSQMDRWARDLDSWDVCDQCCINLFRHTTYAFEKARVWTGRTQGFVKRAGFSLMATLAVHEKDTPDEVFLEFLPLIEREAADERAEVKKSVSWALRQIGKRSCTLHAAATACAEGILETQPNSKPACWIARDALRELRSEKVQEALS